MNKPTFRQRISNFIYPTPEPPKEKSMRFFVSGYTNISRSERDLNDLISAIQSAERETYKDKKSYYDILQECMEYDTHLYSCVQRRLQNLTGRYLRYFTGDVENEEITKLINRQQFKGMLGEIAASLFYGHTLIQFGEQPWEYQLIPYRLIDGEKKQVLKNWLSRSGTPYEVSPGILYDNLLEVGNVWDLGILKQAAMYSILKRNSLGDWAMYSQKAGNNFEKVVYKGDKNLANQVAEAFSNAGSGAAIPIPDGVVDIQTVQTASSQQNQLFVDFFEAMNKEISKLILGQTMTTEDGASYSQSMVHLSQQELIFESDAEWILSILNSAAFKRIMAWFRLDTSGEFQFENQVISIEKEIEKDLKLKELGVVFPAGYLNEKYGVEMEVSI